MPHECEDCGAAFETLTRLRLHDCTSGQSGATTTDPVTSQLSAGTADRDASVPDLDDQLERVADGDAAAVFTAVATYETSLSDALDDGGDGYRDVFWAYYEPVSDALDEVTRSDGWDYLAEVIEAYDPTADDALPLATPAIANAVGRHVIRTRVTDGVAAIPSTALEYLDAVAVHAPDSDDVAREETHAYGWGIGHPDHPVVDRLRDRAPEDIFTVNSALEHAFYADQHAAVDALERLVRDDATDGAISSPVGDDTSHRRFLLDCVYGLQTDDHRPTTPRYWDWREALDYTFELDAAVERRIRDLVAELGFDADLPDDWTFRDLGI